MSLTYIASRYLRKPVESPPAISEAYLKRLLEAVEQSRMTGPAGAPDPLPLRVQTIRVGNVQYTVVEQTSRDHVLREQLRELTQVVARLEHRLRLGDVVVETGRVTEHRVRENRLLENSLESRNLENRSLEGRTLENRSSEVRATDESGGELRAAETQQPEQRLPEQRLPEQRGRERREPVVSTNRVCLTSRNGSSGSFGAASPMASSPMASSPTAGSPVVSDVTGSPPAKTPAKEEGDDAGPRGPRSRGTAVDAPAARLPVHSDLEDGMSSQVLAGLVRFLSDKQSRSARRRWRSWGRPMLLSLGGATLLIFSSMLLWHPELADQLLNYLTSLTSGNR